MGRPAKTLEQKLWPYVNKDGDGGCWVWFGAQCTPNGYGQLYITVDGVKKKLYVHRVAYELVIGNIPDGLEIDHLCRVRNCVNPDHLEAVTHRENILR